ncbi:MAG TPA: ABC-F family ATP-binding cassette domain-containing protein [Ruminiclostridium sp.]|nr:ABC-F family ATP-binding cassette domain-containing protein [Ruminiclostridium sp.]
MIDLAVRDLNKFYGENHVLKGISFEVYSGDKVGLLGKNGSGKTTLFKAISGSLDFESGRIDKPSDRKVGILEQIPVYPEDYSVMEVIKTAFKDIFRLYEEMKRMEILMESDAEQGLLKQYGIIQSRYEAMGGYDADSRIAKVCTGLGIDNEFQTRKFNRLSGGEKTRVNLARIILEDTDILLLDEPTNHLDIKSVEWLEDFLCQFKGTVLVVSHDRYFLDRVIKRIIEIEDGKAVFYEGNYSYYTREKEFRYLQQLARYEQEQKKVRQLEAAAKRLHEWARNADNPALHKRAFAMEKRIERLDKTDRPFKEKKLSSSFKENGFSGKNAVILKDVYKAYGDNCIINGADLIINSGDRIALLGDNGCGKTTLIKVITGEEVPDTGTAVVGESIKYACLQQNISFDPPEYSVLDITRHALNTSEETARRKLAAFNFKGKDVFKQAGSLSGGEKSRLRLCLAMQADINFLVLDEPTNHLDILSREWIEEAIGSFGGTILFVSHDRYFINMFATRIWEMKDGRITDFHGTYEEFAEWKKEVKLKPRIEVPGTSNSARHKDTKKCTKESKADDSTEYEKKILELEERVRILEDEMNEAGCDSARLNELYGEKSMLLQEIDMLYYEWAAPEI